MPASASTLRFLPCGSTAAVRSRAAVVVLLFAFGFGNACHRAPSPESEPEPHDDLAELLREPPPAPEPEEPLPQQWSIQSTDGRWVLRQTTKDGSACTLRCVDRTGGGAPWEAEGCLATRDDVRLLSADGERVLVLHPAPALGAVDIGDIEVGFIAERGDVVRRLVAREFIDVSRFEIVEDGLSWVERGANGVLVQHRGHSAELTLVGRRRATISFDGEVEVSNPITAATPKDEPKAPERCPASVACTWVDANGVFHVVESGALVPERYRDRARPLDGPVTSVGTTTALDDVVLPPPYEPPVRDSFVPSDPADPTFDPPGPNSGGAVTADASPAAGGDSGSEPLEETVLQRAIRLGTRAGAPLPPAPAPLADPDTTPRYETDATGALVPLR